MIRLSCASLSFDGFGDTDFVNTFKSAREAGYTNIEFNCWYPRTLTPRKVRDINARCADAGISASSIHIGGFGGSSNDEITRDLCHKLQALHVAKSLGASVVCATGSPRKSGSRIETVITVLRELMPEAEQQGIRIGLENHADNVIEGPDDYRHIFDAIDSPALGICLDTGHFEAAGIRCDEVVDEFGPKISHIHVKENSSFGVKNFVRFGEGTTDNEAIVERLIREGYSGDIVVELSPESGSADARPFTIEDLITPQKMFSRFVTKK